MNANIAQFLEKLKLTLFSEDDFKDHVCAIVLEKTKFPIEKSCVHEMKGSIKLKADPYLKSEIMFRKEEILDTLRSRYPKRLIKDIS